MRLIGSALRAFRRTAQVTGLVVVLAACALSLAPAPKASAAIDDCCPVGEVEATAATTFVHAFIDRGVAVLRDESLTRQERDAVFHDLILTCFDTEFASQFALGRGWRMASQKQRDEYRRLFREDMLRIGNRLFRSYEDETLEVMRVVPQDGGDLFVHTRLTNPESAVRDVDFRLRAYDKGYLIIDVQLEGFSLLSAYRSEFVGRLLQGGVEGVLEMLRQRIARRAGLSS